MKRICITLIALIFCIGCSALRTTGNAAKTVGKVGWKTAKVTGKVVKTTGKVVYKTGEVAYKTGKATSKGVRQVVYMAKGKQIIPLIKYGNSLYADIKLNRLYKAKFLVDTGASSVQISQAMAKQMNINLDKAEPVLINIAGGQVVSGKKVILKEIRLGSVRVTNVEALVMDYDNLAKDDGLLGMSFFNHFVFQIDSAKPEVILHQKAL